MRGIPEEELRRANQAFYDAFGSRDIEGMDELWARGVPVACIHPGWPVLYGRQDVMSSWRSILLGGSTPKVACAEPQAAVFGDSGFVTCLEHIDDNVLVATNYFVLQDGVWQLVHHQAGPLSAEASAEVERGERTLN